MNANDSGSSVVTLPGLLNIIYRARKLIVAVAAAGLVAGIAYGILTRPLYRATAQVRPGIVSYADSGAPVREWAIKDIVRWFRTELYWSDMRDQPIFARYKRPPIVLAEYIPSGPQYQEGGDVITLTALAPDTLEALAVLREAVTSFNHQASRDTLGSTMHLTRGGARVRMDKIRNDIDLVAAEEARTNLAIAELDRQLTVVAADDRRLQLSLDRLASARAWRERAVETTLADVAAARKRLTEAEELLARVMADEGGQASPPRSGSAETDMLVQVARREQAGRVGELLETVDQLGRRVAAGTVMADSLRDRLTAIDIEMSRIGLEREIDLAKRKADIHQQIDDFAITLESDLPHRRAQLEADWRAEKVRVDLLTPIETVGTIYVTDKPVRPRKLRAAAILTILGFCGGIFLAFVREYYRHNRDAIVTAGD